MRKVLFLDIDGVLNSAEDFLFNSARETLGAEPVKLDENHWVYDYMLSPVKIALMWQICKLVPELEIWVHSSWRRTVPFAVLMDSLKQRFPLWNFAQVKGYVPFGGMNTGDHNHDVQEFIRIARDFGNPIEKFVVVDDHVDQRFPEGGVIKKIHKIGTFGTHGLTIPDCFRIVEVLAGEDVANNWPLVIL